MLCSSGLGFQGWGFLVQDLLGVKVGIFEI